MRRMRPVEELSKGSGRCKVVWHGKGGPGDSTEEPVRYKAVFTRVEVVLKAITRQRGEEFLAVRGQ